MKNIKKSFCHQARNTMIREKMEIICELNRRANFVSGNSELNFWFQQNWFSFSAVLQSELCNHWIFSEDQKKQTILINSA